MVKKIALDKAAFAIVGGVSIMVVAIICAFIFSNGAAFVKAVGLKQFLLGGDWAPDADLYGILPMIAGTVATTVLGLLFAIPLGLGAAIFLTYFCPKRFVGFFTAMCDLLSSIPSVVYGFVALGTVVPAVASVFGGSGSCVFSAAIVLCVMTVSTITSVSRQALASCDKSLMEGALALGATKEEAVFSVEIPAAKSGIIASIILAFCRAAGEAMAVIMVCGNQSVFIKSIFRGARTLTTNIALEMGYAAGLHRSALIASAAVLFLFVMLINILGNALENLQLRRNHEYNAKRNGSTQHGSILWEISRNKGRKLALQGALSNGTNRTQRVREEYITSMSQ